MKTIAETATRLVESVRKERQRMIEHRNERGPYYLLLPVVFAELLDGRELHFEVTGYIGGDPKTRPLREPMKVFPGKSVRDRLKEVEGVEDVICHEAISEAVLVSK
jgi:hypothetical protein